jgi:4-hydroxy-tetrahydrodipicolinate synthase
METSMTTNFDAITGLWVALATPLDTSGAVDHAALVQHAQWLLAEGCDGVVPFGTTGEGASFSAAERLAAVEAMLAGGIPAARIGLGTGFPAIPDTIALTQAMLGLGLTHALVLPPYFYRDVAAQGIEDAFAAIIDGVGDARLRVTLYHIPQVSGVPVPAAIVPRLRERFGAVVAGVKDSSGDFAHFTAFRAAAPDVAIAIGNEADIGRVLAAGGCGTICGLANITPSLVRAMFTEPAGAGPMKAAIALLDGPFVPTLKAALAALSGEPGWLRVRAPLLAAPAEQGARIAAGLKRLEHRPA